MYRIRDHVNLSILKSVYYSLIYSHLIHAIQVWGFASDTELDRILTLQKKAVCMTCKDQYPQIPDPLFAELEILKIHDAFKLQICKFIFDCLSSNSPDIFQNWFTINISVHSYNTTSNTTIDVNNDFQIISLSTTNKLHTRCSKLANYGAKMIKVFGPLLWNKLPENICNSTSVFSLKTNLKKFFIDHYRTDFHVSGFYYVSKLSLCNMKITVSKMDTFHIPPFLPARIPRVTNISSDGLKFKITRL